MLSAPMLSNLRLMVPVLSSAARIPLPGATSALAVSDSVSMLAVCVIYFFPLNSILSLWHRQPSVSYPAAACLGCRAAKSFAISSKVQKLTPGWLMM